MHVFGPTALLLLIAVLPSRIAPAQDVAQSIQSVKVGEAEIELRFDERFSMAQREELTQWVRARAEIVAGYYGRFPVSHAILRIQATNGRGVRGGTAFPAKIPFIRLRVGVEFDASRLKSDWVLVHELTHLALPNVDDEYLWLAEGMATYVEGVARLQAGDIDAQQLWGDLFRGLPQGLPQAGDRGLDRTPTWGRRYWGGALFCLLADVELRKETKNRKGFQQALRGILEHSGGFTVEWSAARILASGDAAIDTKALALLYEQHRATAVDVDLSRLARDLGIKLNGGEVTFDDTASLAAIRKGIEMGNGIDATGSTLVGSN